MRFRSNRYCISELEYLVKRDLPKFQTDRLREWNAAIAFFAEKKDVIKERRHAYGGHFLAKVSKYILDLDSEESVGTLEIKLGEIGSEHYVFKFAETLVSVGLFYGSGEQDRRHRVCPCVRQACVRRASRDTCWILVHQWQRAYIARRDTSRSSTR